MVVYTLPIFPLEDLILFPGTFLPLHIFEPRYRLLLNYALENDSEIGISSMERDGSIPNIFGWGKIIEKEMLPDGRSNIVIHGRGIARLLRFESEKPFLIAQVELKENTYDHLNKVEFREILQEIIRLAQMHLKNIYPTDNISKEMERVKQHPYPVDILTSILDLKYSHKYEILKTENHYDKAKLLLKFVKNLIREQNS